MEELPNGVLVTFKKIDGGISQVLAHIKMNPGCKTADIATRLNASLRTVGRLLIQLKNENSIIFSGHKKTGGYSLKEPDEVSE